MKRVLLALVLGGCATEAARDKPLKLAASDPASTCEPSKTALVTVAQECPPPTTCTCPARKSCAEPPYVLTTTLNADELRELVARYRTAFSECKS